MKLLNLECMMAGFHAHKCTTITCTSAASGGGCYVNYIHSTERYKNLKFKQAKQHVMKCFESPHGALSTV